MPAPLLASWVIPGVLTLLALTVSAVLVIRTHQRRLAEIPELDDVDLLPEPIAEPTDTRVLQRQVEVLTKTLEEWDTERRQAVPATSAPAPAPGPVAVPSGPPTSYAALSRDLAAAGDAPGAVVAQWAADLQVLRPALGDHGPDLARAVAAVDDEDPVQALRTCREAALGLVRQAGPVRALLAPLDHLADLAPGEVPTVLPAALVDLLGPDQRERLAQRGLTA